MGNDVPIGIFDSGIGGLTVVKEIMKVMPNENLIYFGDTARAPYGSRSPAQITEFMHQILCFFTTQQVKMAVYACNTMTALGLSEARQRYPFMCIGMSTGIGPALAVSKNKNIGVIATQATIASGSHAKAIQAIEPEATIYPQACPKFVPLIENEIIEGAMVDDAALEYLLPLKDAGIDVVVLGCTHYPYISNVIARIMGPEVAVVDPAYDTAMTAVEALRNTGQLTDRDRQGQVRLCFSADVERAKRMAGLVMDTNQVQFELVNLQEFLLNPGNNGKILV